VLACFVVLLLKYFMENLSERFPLIMKQTISIYSFEGVQLILRLLWENIMKLEKNFSESTINEIPFDFISIFHRYIPYIITN